MRLLLFSCFFSAGLAGAARTQWHQECRSLSQFKAPSFVGLLSPDGLSDPTQRRSLTRRKSHNERQMTRTVRLALHSHNENTHGDSCHDETLHSWNDVGVTRRSFGMAASQGMASLLLATPIHNANAAGVAPLADVGLREFVVKDGMQHLRLSLPTSLPTSSDPAKVDDVGRQVQEAVELVRLRLEQVGFSGRTPVWNAAVKEVNTASTLVSTDEMLKNIPGAQLSKAKALVKETAEKLTELAAACREQNNASTLKLQDEVANLVYQIRLLSLKKGTLPFTIPAEYASFPQLRGRAIVECVLNRPKGAGQPFILEGGAKTMGFTMTMVIDGYHTPITAGNFIDLVQRKFYDGFPIQGVGDITVQTGKGKEQERVLPLEIFYKKDKQPTYEYTSDDDMRATESMAVPFQAYGAIGMAHDPEDANTASTEFYFLKWDQALVAPARNTLDGSQACLGYVVKNQELLKQVKVGDEIVSMKVVEGADNLYLPK